jgi:hypothetical protein
VVLKVMSRRIEVRVELRETPTARAIWAALPIEAPAQRWGGELYLALPLDLSPEPDAQQIVAPGSLGYWCEGAVVTAALGPTPISLAQECRLVAPVNIWGRVDGDVSVLGRVEEGDVLRLRPA